MPTSLPPIRATVDYRTIKRLYGARKPMTADINRDFVLSVDDMLIPCRVNYIQDSGRMNVTGPSPAIRRLMNQGQSFTIRRAANGEVMVSGQVIKVEEVEVMDVTIALSDEAAVIQNDLTLLCLIDKCTFFEPVKV